MRNQACNVSKMILATHSVQTVFIDVEKTIDGAELEVMWGILKAQEWTSWLLDRVEAFYRKTSTCAKVKEASV